MRRATFWFIFGTVLLDMLALGIIAPVLPKLVILLEGGNETSAAGLFGVFGTVWATMQFVFAPVLGALSDRVGRRPDRKSTRLNSSHMSISYAVFCLKKKKHRNRAGAGARGLPGQLRHRLAHRHGAISTDSIPHNRAAKTPLRAHQLPYHSISQPVVV